MKVTVFSMVFCCLLLPLTTLAATNIRVLDKNNSPLANAVVSIPNSKAETSAWSTRYSIDQVDRQFKPQIMVVPVNSIIDFPNSDDVRHHVYSFSEAKTFELRLYHADEADPVTFDKTGVVTIGCNIHDSMRAYLLVTDDGIFGQTNGQGIYQLPESQAEINKIHVWYPPLDNPVVFDIDPANAMVSVALNVSPLSAPAIVNESSLEERLKRYKRNAQ